LPGPWDSPQCVRSWSVPARRAGGGRQGGEIDIQSEGLGQPPPLARLDPRHRHVAPLAQFVGDGRGCGVTELDQQVVRDIGAGVQLGLDRYTR